MTNKEKVYYTVQVPMNAYLELKVEGEQGLTRSQVFDLIKEQDVYDSEIDYVLEDKEDAWANRDSNASIVYYLDNAYREL